jgi:hypothetical protein
MEWNGKGRRTEDDPADQGEGGADQRLWRRIVLGGAEVECAQGSALGRAIGGRGAAGGHAAGLVCTIINCVGNC